MPLSFRLMLIIATCLVPTIALHIAVSFTQWTERKQDLWKLATQQAELLAGNMYSISEGARILLSTAAELHPLMTPSAECDARLTKVRRNAPSFAFVALVDGEGRIACASEPAPARDDGASWIADAKAAPKFTAGHFAQSPEYPGGFLPYFFPLPSGPDGRTATLVAALDLTWLSEHLHNLRQSGLSFESRGVLTIFDQKGVILGRSPEPARFVGKILPPNAISIINEKQPGFIRLKSIDGTERTVGYVPPAPATYSLATAVGFYEPELMNDLRVALGHGALMLIATTAAAVILTWLVARRFITRPTNALLEATRRWQEGDLSARAPSADQRSEFGLIANACNRMAEALGRRQEALRRDAERMQAEVEERTRQLLVTNNRLHVEIEERHNTEAALVQSQKLLGAGQLAGGIAHDFNNLLAIIQGSLDMLARTMPRTCRKEHGWVERAQGAVTRGAHLTNRLLAFSRRRRLSVRATDVNRLIEDMTALFGATRLGHRIEIRTVLAKDLWMAMAEPNQVEAALLNLTLNARDAMPDGGTLTIRTSNIVQAEQGHDIRPGDYVSITVSDTGSGMTEEVSRRALEPFFTTKGEAGSGLGLSQVQAMAQASGGVLRLWTRVGEGTSFTLMLPRAAEEAEPARKAPPPAFARRGESILLVDDDPNVIEVTADMLRQLHYTVTLARNGQQALEVWDSMERQPAIVMLDFAMPAMSGLALALALRERGFQGPIILATGYADISEIDDAEPGVFQAVMNKPYAFHELEEVLARVSAEAAARAQPRLVTAER
ncbi:MAG: ATP-binding protein [Acetobacteraceae bacterium]